jgi:AcrR family transcriptional regulator
MRINQLVNTATDPQGAREDARPAEEHETRERLLAAAHRVFLRKGTANARTQEIADEAGVNKALLHYYYGTKAALADAIFAHHVRRLIPTMFGILADPNRTIPDKVRDLVREQITFQRANPYLAGFLAAELHAEPDRIRRLMTEHGAPPHAVMQQQIDRAVAAGQIRPIPAVQLVLTIMGATLLPFIMRPMLGPFFGLEGEAFDAFLDQRLTVLPDLIIAGLRP